MSVAKDLGCMPRTSLLIALVVLAVTMPFPAEAREDLRLPSPLQLEDALRIARRGRPEIRAAARQAEAAAARPDVVDAIDDPMLMTSIDHLPLDLGGVDLSAAVEVSFPMSGVLGHRRRVAEAEAERLLARVDRKVLEVELEAATAFLMLYEARHLTKVLRTQAELAEQLREAALVRQSAGVGGAAEALRAAVEVSRARAAVRINRAQRRAAAAMLNVALGRSVTAALPRLDFRLGNTRPAGIAALVARAKRARPELREADAEIARSRAEIDAMEAMYAPMAVVRLGPAYTMDAGPGVMFMFGVSLPLDSDKRQAGVREARAMAAMAEADKDAMALMIAGDVANAREAVEVQHVRLAAARDEIVPAARAAVEVSLAAYASGDLPLVSVIDALAQLGAARLDEVRAEVALGTARARLRRALGQRGGR
jgi:outer membrane protein, heavy metal efflux system